MATSYSNNHDAVGAWFLGPHAENFEVLERIFQGLLYEQAKARAAYFPNDDDFITPSMKASKLFQKNISKLKYVVNQLAPQLAAHSVPFWNPRYNAHMNMDTTMPGMAGYLMAMMYNPNNVATEASPLTTALEIDVGKQLCEMVGYNIKITTDTTFPVAWGHITCDGSVANLESMWAARNLKYYPLSVRLAMETGGPLEFIANTFRLRDNDEKLFKDLTTWELLNIPPGVVLDIPDRLRKIYSITSQFLQTNLKKYLVQTVGKDSNIFQKFNTTETKLNEMVYFVSTAKHYSWPKAAAVIGIGSENVIDVNVDDGARIDVDDLKTKLKGCLENKRAVYAVVAIIGSTEHGACDPLDKIVSLRGSTDLTGLSFVLHADAAWGAYFCSTLRSKDLSIPMGFVPAIVLKPSTVLALDALNNCDSITVDPHKSGYIQYPAGGLLYRDQRMRYLITWTSPIVYRNELESIGIYGIEGSKPGAAPVATWVSHEVIGLHNKGYGALLGEAVFSCVKMYAHLATMSTDTTDFIVVPMNALPPATTEIPDVKKFIRDEILDVDNKVLVTKDTAMKLLIKMGSDLAINAFAVNFRYKNREGHVVDNQDVVEANNLSKRIFGRLSISKVTDSVPDTPLILTSTQFTQDSYKTCLTNFKSRLSLAGAQDLYVLVNVVMSPFPTEGNFTREIAKALKKVIEEEVRTSKYRNEVTPDFHGFIIQGTRRFFFVHLPMFNMANHRYQLIITGDLPLGVMTMLQQARIDHPDQYFTLGNANKDTLSTMLGKGRFEAVIDKGLPPPDGTHFITGFELTNIRPVVMNRLDSKHLSATYPQVGMPFYLYGSRRDGDPDPDPDPEYHIDHALAAAPNTQFTGGEVTISMNDGDVLPSFTEASPCIKIIVDLPERAMQPFPPNKDLVSDPDFFFRPGKVLPFTVTVEGVDLKGSLTLTKNVFVDTDMLNEDPVPEKGEPEEVEPDEGDSEEGDAEEGDAEEGEPARRVPTKAIRVHTITHRDTVAPRRGWQDIVDSFPRPYDE